MELGFLPCNDNEWQQRRQQYRERMASKLQAMRASFQLVSRRRAVRVRSVAGCDFDPFPSHLRATSGWLSRRLVHSSRLQTLQHQQPWVCWRWMQGPDLAQPAL